MHLIHPEAAAGGEGVDAREGDASMARVTTGNARKTTQETFVQSPPVTFVFVLFRCLFFYYFSVFDFNTAAIQLIEELKHFEKI